MYISTGGLSGWGTICDDNWDIQDARVVCHELGYPYAVAAPLNAHYGEGTGPIWLSNIQCLGNETDIFSCLHIVNDNQNCIHDEDASVKCSCKLAALIYLYLNLLMLQGTYSYRMCGNFHATIFS